MGIRIRSVGAVLLGGCAGLSLTATILPTVISTLGLSDSFSARIDLAGFAVYAFMLWAVGGWAAQRTANTAAGGVILGLVGLVSGAIFTGMAFGAGVKLLLIGGTAGLAYGTVGGMLIANALAGDKRPPSDDTPDRSKADRSRHAGRKKPADRESIRLFRFFK